MLDITKRIELINALIKQDTEESLTYAALECRLTLEYLCYERFKLYFPYLSQNDLDKWQPRHIIKQISEQIDQNVSKEFSVSISTEKIDGRPPATKEEYESIAYTHLGTQSELNFKELGTLWHSLSNVALHIPVPSISSGDINIYGKKEIIRKKVEDVISFLSDIKGNLLMGGSFGEDLSFNCLACETKLKRPIRNLQDRTVLSCINPNCVESYLIEKKNDSFEIIRKVIKFLCAGCDEELVVPTRYFQELRFENSLEIPCHNCDMKSVVIMRPQLITPNP
tara:strand:- start:1137 stop:1979 length:843 start_codon:yes stop_codon:yes gene_type:complete